MPKETNKRTARQKDADELHMTSNLAAPSINLLTLIESNTDSIDTTLDISLSVFRDAILGANTKDFSTIQTVLDSIKDTDGIKKITDTVTVAGTVTANAGTNLNTSALATHAKQDTIIGHIDGIEAFLATIDADTSQLDITLSALRDAIRGASTKDFSTLEADIESIKDTDGIKKITDTVTVAPSGDMARKHYYDRNAALDIDLYGVNLAAHAWTVRFTYTVAANKAARHNFTRNRIQTAIATAGKIAALHLELYDGSGYGSLVSAFHWDTSGPETIVQLTIPVVLAEGQGVRGSTYSNDTVNHFLDISSFKVEYDA